MIYVVDKFVVVNCASPCLYITTNLEIPFVVVYGASPCLYITTILETPIMEACYHPTTLPRYHYAFYGSMT